MTLPLPVAAASRLFASCLLGCLALTLGCAWTSDGGLGARVESDLRTKSSAEGSFGGEPIVVRDAHGQIEIVGIPGKSNITVRAKMVAGARSQADANAAFDDLFESVSIEARDGAWVVACEQARAWHGSVDPASTGCTRMRVEVPAGTAEAPLAIDARADYGGVHATGLVVERFHATAPFGLLADVTAIPGADIELRGQPIVSGFCSSVLRVPQDFAADAVALSVKDVHLEYVGPRAERLVPGVVVEGLDDPNAPSDLAPRTPLWEGRLGALGEGAARVLLHADQGKAMITTAPLPPATDMNACAREEPLSLRADV
jgi:hypothetical protein